ncbi:MAG: isoprenyl transferase [Armatimonadetes bacterium]|jgi:undecaprenyl diphosphate synthase|nr:isoprenyl transferase [Armatimonadota bacterium]HOM82728.1 isoprenyl transferase [Armatimonadota bacterium]HPO73464.1 isoprenyl transferase [Armatimonadota bacterium]
MGQTLGAARLDETDEELLERVRKGAIPRHVAIIMDGNGRWASRQGLPRITGHRAGAESVRTVVEAALELGIEVLTLYTFSVENWRRPQEEVEALMLLIEHLIHREIEALHAGGVRLGVLGRIHELPPSLQEELRRDMEMTAGNKALLLNLAINYGGRAEIVDAARALARRVQAGTLDPDDIEEDVISNALYTAGLPDPDLLIRTAGELRVSNYLLWQIAYTEMWVTDVPWPAFSRRLLLEAIADYQRRQRKFGMVLDS